jgi:hypothetical protein
VDNIKIGLREIGWGGMEWIDLAQDKDCSCKRDNEVSDSTKWRKVLEQLHNW